MSSKGSEMTDQSLWRILSMNFLSVADSQGDRLEGEAGVLNLPDLDSLVLEVIGMQPEPAMKMFREVSNQKPAKLPQEPEAQYQLAVEVLRMLAS